MGFHRALKFVEAGDAGTAPFSGKMAAISL
jgi:hypothetical protein